MHVQLHGLQGLRAEMAEACRRLNISGLDKQKLLTLSSGYGVATNVNDHGDAMGVASAFSRLCELTKLLEKGLADISTDGANAAFMSELASIKSTRDTAEVRFQLQRRRGCA